MSRHPLPPAKELNYWKHPLPGFPKKIYWEKQYGPGKLTQIQEYDLIFDERDLKIRKLV